MNIDLKGYVKLFQLPDNFAAPLFLEYEDIQARPLTRTDLQADLEGVNTSIQIIQSTRGGSWPTEPLSEEFDFLDLAWHEREFRDNSSFAYVMYDANAAYVGCFYLYPLGVRTELSEQVNQHDVDVSWWVTASKYDNGYYEKAYFALQEWLRLFPFANPYYSNKQIPSNDSKPQLTS